MPLIRKTRVSGRNIVLAIPSQLVEDGDELEIIPLGHGEFKIRKAKKVDGGTP